MSPVITSVERLVTKVRIWRYTEQSSNQARGRRNTLERLQIARVSHLH
jgi:hypothetical protein